MEQLTLKYRPRNLDELTGQDHIVVILKSMLKKYFDEGTALPAGMMFCGSRGIGKTTSARILSRLLNCNDRTELTSCGVCSSCKQIDKGNDTNVIELDAASNGLVDDIRKLKEVALTSHSGNFRIFVLDEVHGMSNAAFQALLKILEEPPGNTMFIMATTEPHKVPDTIISRVMVFDYKRIAVDDIVARLNYIAEKEGIKIEPDAAMAIARYVDGGMRDAIMALDQLRYVGDVITLDTFKDFYGIVDTSFYSEMTRCLASGNISDGLLYMSDAFGRSSDSVQIVDGFAEFLKDLLLVKYNVIDNHAELAEKFTDAQLLSMINVIWDIRSKVRYTGLNNRTVLDLMYVMMARSIGKSAPAVAKTTQKVGKETLRGMFG